MPDLTEQDHFALFMWNRMQLLGPDLAFRLSDAKLNHHDLDDLLARISTIESASKEATKHKKV